LKELHKKLPVIFNSDRLQKDGERWSKSAPEYKPVLTFHFVVLVDLCSA